MNCESGKLESDLLFIQSSLTDFQIDCHGIQRSVYCSKLILLENFDYLKWNMF